MPNADELAAFAKRMKVVGDGVEKNATEIIRRAALACDNALVFSTPVDTGRARANWNVAVGNPVTSYSERTDYSASLGEGARVIEGWKVGEGPIFISNNLPYIVPLEHGWSKQAPSGMTSFGIQAAINELHKGGLLQSSVSASR